MRQNIVLVVGFHAVSVGNALNEASAVGEQGRIAKLTAAGDRVR